MAVYAFTQWRGASTASLQHLPILALQQTKGDWLRYRPEKHQITLINFWSPDCPPCIAEIPALNLLQEWLGGDGFTVLGIAVAGNTPRAVAKAGSRYGIVYPVYLDNSGEAARLLGGITLTPTSLLVNAHGRVVGRYVGVISLPVILWRLLWMPH